MTNQGTEKIEKIKDRLPVAIIADDLTGANDTAVQFAQAGWNTVMLLDPMQATPNASAASAFALTADNRALAGTAAQHKTEQAVTAALHLGAQSIYLKIDSTVRGSVKEQIHAALQVWQQKRADTIAIVAPSYPKMGRTVTDGVLYVNGVPVADTPIGIDPVTPVTQSNLLQWIPQSEPLDCSSIARIRDKIQEAAKKSVRILLANASTEADLQRLAQVIAECGNQIIPVGSAGLAGELAQVWRSAEMPVHAGWQSWRQQYRPQHALLQISSLHQVSRQQLDALLLQHPTIVHCAPATSDLLNLTALKQWLAQQTPVILEENGIAIISSPIQRAEISEQLTAADIAARLAHITVTLLQSQPFSLVGLVGGDGARSVLQALQIQTLQVLGSIEEGIPLCIALDGDFPGIAIFTKAGGFGSDSSLQQVLTCLGHAD